MPNKVRPPAILRSDNMHPSVSQVTVIVVWTRYTIMTAEILNAIDDCQTSERDEVIQGTVDTFCLGLESLMKEWNLESIMRDDSQTETLRYLVADHSEKRSA